MHVETVLTTKLYSTHLPYFVCRLEYLLVDSLNIE